MTKKRYTIQATCRDRKGNILSIAQNSYTKTHPIQAHFASLVGEPERKYLHAEIWALIRAGERRIYSLTIQSLNGVSKPFPCLVCQKAIQAWGVKKVIVL
jgi:deoxycytidylate deaminase